jgi:hypothetical protein
VSIFDLIHEAEMERESESMKKEYTAMKKFMNKKPSIDEQTTMLWTLQLQFISMDTLDLVNTYISSHGYFPRTKHVKRSYRRCLKHLSLKAGITQEEHNCIATTLAINLAGIQ